ncbi:MAG: hypothetical protein GY880_29870, partial [Planctomycetaceae bacterium]|nr:hypothetical protein [Planctomycetaceae bacterium]
MKHTPFKLIQCFEMTLLLLVTSMFGVNSEALGQDEDSSKKLTLVCSTTQIADFARNIVGDRWE